MLVMTTTAVVTWLFYDEQGLEQERHPLLTLLHQRNALQDGMAMLEQVYADLLIAVCFDSGLDPDGDCLCAGCRNRQKYHRWFQGAAGGDTRTDATTVWRGLSWLHWRAHL